MAVFMFQENQNKPFASKTQIFKIASYQIADAFTDFILSRKAMQCSAKTLKTYQSILGKFVRWVESQGITAPDQLTARHVRAFMAELHGKQWTLNGYGRAIRTLLKFWHQEGYMPTPVKVDVPPVGRQRLPFLTASQVKQLLDVCDSRDRAMILLMVDSGLRRQEVCNLNKSDLDLETGGIHVRQGKGHKDRITAIGATTRRAILLYIRIIPNQADNAPLFQTQDGYRLTGDGIQSIFRRLSKVAGFKVSAHMLRRTFATLALKAGLDVVSLQSLLGHSSLETTRRYIQLLDDDLLQAHHQYSPIDNLRKFK